MASIPYKNHQLMANEIEQQRKQETANDDQNGRDDDDLQVKKNFTHVRVLHNFRGENNDELCVKRDDIITLTQTPSGGWWEGTIDGITGWFPANYVTPVVLGSDDSVALDAEENHSSLPHASSGSISLKKSSSRAGSVDYNVPSDNLAEYRAIVIKDIRDSEAIFIQSLHDAITHYLQPLAQYKVLPSETEINAVLRTTSEICNVHRHFLTLLDRILKTGGNRIGGLFMQVAPQIQQAHFDYCSHHAKFVHLIEKFKSDICAFFTHSGQTLPLIANIGSPLHQPSQSVSHTPNVLITSSLSVSFRRLDKYPALLQELQRYTEEAHVDRGDTQRAGFLYREIAMACLELRRRKEMELEVMLGNIRNFEGLSIETFGNIIRMEPATMVLIKPVWQESKKDCYLVLFPRVLMVLSVGNEMTSFTYESMMTLEAGRLQMIHPAGESATDLYRFECSGHSAHPKSEPSLVLTYLVQLTSDEVWKDWCQALQRQIRHCTRGVSLAASGSSLVDRNSSNGSSLTSPTSPPTSSTGSGNAGVAGAFGGVLVTPSSSSSVCSPRQSTTAVSCKPPVPGASNNRRPPPATPLPLAEIIASLPKIETSWQELQLSPHLPYRPFHVMAANHDHSIEPNDEDMKILHLIDNYCRKLPLSGGGGGGASASASLNRDGSVRTRKFSNSMLDSTELDNVPEPHQIIEMMEDSSVLRAALKQHTAASGKKQANNAKKNSLHNLASKLKKMSLSALDRDILYEVYDQLRLMRAEMNEMKQTLAEERRQRVRLQQALYVKRD